MNGKGTFLSFRDLQELFVPEFLLNIYHNGTAVGAESFWNRLNTIHMGEIKKKKNIRQN